MRKVLVIADLEEPGLATRRGLEMADKLKAAAEVIAFVYAPLKQLKVSEDSRASIKKQLIADREQEVQARIDRSRHEGQKVKLRVVWEKDVAGWVTNHCAHGNYALVVKTRRQSETIIHTSSDWQLLRECPAPLLIVAAGKWPRTKRVRASLDLSTRIPAKKKLNEKILEEALELAELMETSVDIICAIEIPTLLSDLDLVDARSYVADAREAMAPNIKALAKKFNLSEEDFHVKRGPVDKVIASEAASRRAQIVVMGTVGRKGVKARLLGNTAERVLRHLKTDVLALKP